MLTRRPCCSMCYCSVYVVAVCVVAGCCRSLRVVVNCCRGRGRLTRRRHSYLVRPRFPTPAPHVLQHFAMCCSVLQILVMCCSVCVCRVGRIRLMRERERESKKVRKRAIHKYIQLRYTCCCSVRMLQCAYVAVCVCCRVRMLQCAYVAVCVCCSVRMLQCACVAVCVRNRFVLHDVLVTVCFAVCCIVRCSVVRCCRGYT